MIKIIQFISIATSGLFLFCFHSLVFAQFNNTLENQFLSGFSEDGRIKLLLLNFQSPPDAKITEAVIENFVTDFQHNLSNTNRFTVVGPKEIREHLQDNPLQANCTDIACGLQIGKLFNADKVIVGKIRVEPFLDENSQEIPDGRLLSIRLLDVLTNATDFSDEIQFTDENQQDELFTLAERISYNTLLKGRLLSVEQKNVVLDLGRSHGLKRRDRIIIYTQTSMSNLAGDTLGLEQTNIAIAEIDHLNDFSANAIVLYQYAAPAPGDLVKTYINRQKQIQLVANIRRELDTRKRLARPVRPLDLEPKVLGNVTGDSFDAGKIQWQQQLEKAESEQKRWMAFGIGAGIGLVLLLNKSIDLGEFQQVAVMGAGALGGYSTYKYFQLRNQIKELKAEGRVKKYLSHNNYQFHIEPKSLKVSLFYQF